MFLSGFLVGQQQKMTDNLPGYVSYLGSSVDTSFTFGRVDAGFFGDRDMALSLFDRENGHISSYFVGTSGREQNAHATSLKNSVFLTGQTNLNTGNFDDVLVARVDIDDETKSWVKVYQANSLDKGKRIFTDNDTLLVLATSSSFTTKQSLYLMMLDLDGNTLNSIEADFDKDFFPTGFSSNNVSYFISGYTVDGALLTGVILSVNKLNGNIEWAKQFENINSSEINQVEYTDGVLYFSGWSGDGAGKLLLYGEMTSSGDISWMNKIQHTGLSTTTSIYKKNDDLFLGGFIRESDGTEENQTFSHINLSTKELDMYAIPDEGRTVSTSPIFYHSDTCFIASYWFDAAPQQGIFNYWEHENGGCFDVYSHSGEIDYTLHLSVSDISVNTKQQFFTELDEGGVQVESDPFYAADFCERVEYDSTVGLNETFCDLELETNLNQIKLISPCKRIVNINIYNSLGVKMFSSGSNIAPSNLLSPNQIYFIKVIFEDGTSTTLKYIR